MTDDPPVCQSPQLRQSRIPAALQAVFLASNRGNQVDLAPPDQVASKCFPENWSLQQQQQKQQTTTRTTTTSQKSKTNRHQGQEPQEQQPSDNNDVTALGETPEEECFEAPTPELSMPPQVYLDAMLRSRGYSTRRYKTLQTSFGRNRPSALQQASYSVHLIQVVRRGDAATLERLLQAGLSPNPCNPHGESALHTACRRGDAPLLAVFLRHGATVAVSDDYGRTLLHDACWCAEPPFAVVRLLLQQDVRLLHLMDAHDRLPLGYVRDEHAAQWNAFLQSVQNEYWPQRTTQTTTTAAGNDENGETAEEPPAPLRLTPTGPNSHPPLPDPPHALTPELAALVANQRISPQEARVLNAMNKHKQNKTNNNSKGMDDDDKDETTMHEMTETEIDGGTSSSSFFEDHQHPDLFWTSSGEGYWTAEQSSFSSSSSSSEEEEDDEDDSTCPSSSCVLDNYQYEDYDDDDDDDDDYPDYNHPDYDVDDDYEGSSCCSESYSDSDDDSLWDEEEEEEMQLLLQKMSALRAQQQQQQGTSPAADVGAPHPTNRAEF